MRTKDLNSLRNNLAFIDKALEELCHDRERLRSTELIVHVMAMTFNNNLEPTVEQQVRTTGLGREV